MQIAKILVILLL